MVPEAGEPSILSSASILLLKNNTKLERRIILKLWESLKLNFQRPTIWLVMKSLLLISPSSKTSDWLWDSSSLKRAELLSLTLSNGMRDYSTIKKLLKSSESPGFAPLKLSLTSKLLRRRKRRRKKKRRKKRKLLSPRRSKRRKNNLKKRKNPRRNKIKRRKRNLMLKKKKSQLKRRKSILLTCSPNLPSTLMIGKESSVTHPTKLPLLTSFGLNSITKDGLSGKSTTLNTKEKVLLVIWLATWKTDTSEILTSISENTALLSMVSTERKETTKLTVFSCGEELKSLKHGKSTTLMSSSPSPDLMRTTQLSKNSLPSIGSTLTRLTQSREEKPSTLKCTNEVIYP